MLLQHMTGYSNLSMVQYFSSGFYILELHALFAHSYGAIGIWVDNRLICGINTVTTFTFLYHIGGMKVNVNTYEFAFCTVCTVCSVDTHYAMNLLLAFALVITMNSSQSACAVIWNNFSCHIIECASYHTGSFVDEVCSNKPYDKIASDS